MIKKTALFALAALVLTSSAVRAYVPGTMNYQGRLTDGVGDPLNGTFSMTFSLYDVPAGGTALWTETHPSVTVAGGLFNVLLGEIGNLTDAHFSGSQRYLGVTVEADPEMAPRTQIVAVGYSYRVSTVDSASGGTILGDIFLSSTANVNAMEINQSGIGRGLRIGMDNAGSTESGLVIAMQGSGSAIGIVTDGGGPAIDVIGGAGDGSVNLPPGSISGFEITDGSVFGIDIADGSVTSADIADGTIVGADIASSAITSSKVADNSLTDQDLAPFSVGTSELQNNSVVSSKISDGAIQNQDIADDEITAAKLADEAGAAQNVSAANFGVTGLNDDILTRNITTPASGYVLVMASAEASILHTSGTDSELEFGVSDFQTGKDGDQAKKWRIPATASTGVYRNVLSAQKIFATGAGAKQFWIICSNIIGPATMNITNISLSTVYLPSSYGAVTE